MPNYPLLPPLKDDKAVGPLPNTGHWHSVNAVALDNISRSLKFTTAAAKFTDIDSIPSMWARPLLFEMALYDTAHPMHKCILGEWRGLLAMLALKEQQNFSLTTKIIEIPDTDSEDIPEFLRALRRLLPEHTLEANTTWDKLYLILFNGEPIGMTSPTTIICTSIDYTDYISDVPWFDGQFLCDPIAFLDQEESAAVAGWLNHFHETQIAPLPDANLNLNEEINDRIKFIKDRLNGQILDFMKELGGVPQTMPDLSDTGLGIEQGFFVGMNKPIAAKEFLTQKLFVVTLPDAFCGSLRPKISGEFNINGRRVTPILPIKSEMLSELNVSDLNKQITFEKTEKGIKVTLRTPSGLEKTQEYIEREEGVEPFSESREIVEIDNVPVLEIWPNFKKSDWQVYYTYFTSADQDTFYAVPYGTHVSQQRVGNSSNIEKEITKTSHFPEVMVCKYKDTSDYEEAGILLISEPDSLPDGERTWNIGIDFGTSGTTVYRNDIDDQQSTPDAMKFANRLLQVTESGDYRERLYDDFFSPKPEPEQTPFLSFFQHFSKENKTILEPLLNGHIHFVSNYHAFPTAQQIFTDLKWSPHADDRIRARVFLEQLCLQCAAEAATERVRKTNWHFSYPIAFSEDDREGFRQIWQHITEACSTVTGLQHGEVSSEPESIAAAKFFASTRQSKDAIGAFATGAVCIDIGGETSDISIWQYNKLYWQASLRLAGRRFLLNILKENPEFLENFEVGSSDIKLLKDASKKKASDFYAQADAWIAASINSDTQNWWQRLEIYTGKSQVKTFVQLIALGISGLLYYIGLILKCLSQTENFERRMPSVYIGGNGARILHWLANGKFDSNEISKKRLKQILLDASGFDTDINRFDLEISKSPKEEASYGLVQSETFLEWTQDQLGKTDVLAGETFIENGEKKAWTEILTPERLASGLDTTEELELEQIRDFVESFNKSGWSGEKITLDQRTHDFILAQLQNTFQKFRNDTPENLHIEPLFILALKLLLEWKTNQWS